MKCPIPPALNRGVYSWDASRLHSAYNVNELAAAIQQISGDPANRNPDHASGRSIHLLTKAARARTDALAWAVFYHQQDKRRTGSTP